MTDQDNSTAAAPALAQDSSANVADTAQLNSEAEAPAPINIHQHKEGFRAILMDDALEVEEAFEKAWKWLISASTPAPTDKAA